MFIKQLIRALILQPVQRFHLFRHASWRQMMNHQKCRNCVYPLSTVDRQAVPEDKSSWTAAFDGYNPPSYTAPSAIRKPWADPDIDDDRFQPQWNSLDGQIDRRSHSDLYEIVHGRPRNPVGRTGISGRGLLGRWGPNHAADPIVTRWKTDLNNGGNRVHHEKTRLPIMQFVAIERKDTKEWAIPGGMIDPGELVSKTLQREFAEEAMNLLEMDDKGRHKLQEQIKDFLLNGTEIYKGYVDDPRNTDNAWMETVAMNFHDDTGQTVGRFQLCAGDDAGKVQWMDIDSGVHLYASHAQILEKVAQLRKAHW